MRFTLEIHARKLSIHALSFAANLEKYTWLFICTYRYSRHKNIAQRPEKKNKHNRNVSISIMGYQTCRTLKHASKLNTQHIETMVNSAHCNNTIRNF